MECNLIGQRFGRLTVIDVDYSKGSKHWKCKCDCGNYTITKTYLLKSGHTKSCGCYKSEQIAKRNTKYSTKRNNVLKIENGIVTFEDEKHNECMVSLEDWDYLKQWYWRKSFRSNRKKRESYWITNAKKKDLDGGSTTSLKVHQMVIVHQFGEYDKSKYIVDHKDRNIDNNTRTNLELKTNLENCHNRDISISNKSGATGVYQSKENNKWMAMITVDYKGIYLGRFDTKEEAVKARREAERRYGFSCE